MKKIFTLITLCALATAFSAVAQAAPIYGTDHYDGNFANKSDVLQFTFSITENQSVWIFTDSYYSDNVDTGFILWNADTGKIVGASEDGNITTVKHADTGKDGGSSNVAKKDAVLIRDNLEVGNYIITLMPTINGQPADGYHYGNIADLEDYRNCLSGTFTGNFSLNIVYKGDPSAVPIPASALLLAPGLMAIGALRRKFS